MLLRKREVELSELAESIANFYCPTGVIIPSEIAERIGISYNYGEYGNAFDGLIE